MVGWGYLDLTTLSMDTCSTVSVCELPRGRKAERLLHRIVFGREVCPWCSGCLLYRKTYAWGRVCRKKVRPKALTWLRHSKLSAEVLLQLVLAWQRKQAPGACVSLLGLSYPTVQRWYGRCRDHLPDNLPMLDGPTEVDESFFGRRRFGHQTLVAGAKARSRQLRLSVIQDRGSFALTGFLLQALIKGSLLLTDMHAGYGEAEAYYPRICCNHSLGDYGSTAGIENVWSRAKRQLRRQYGAFYPFHLKGLLREWEARHNYPELFTSPTAYLEKCLVLCSLT